MATFTQRGKRWRAQVRRNGRTISATFATKTDARAWATEQEAAIERGALSGLADTDRTFGQALERYGAEVSPGKKGAQWELIRITTLSADKLAAVPLVKMAPAHIADWRDRRLLQVSAATVNRELNLISAILNHARTEWRWLQSNPVADIKRPTNPPPRDRRISDAEIAQILTQLSFDGATVASKQDQLAVAFLLALETAMRKSEILGLRWVDVSDRSVRLQATKNGSRRDVPLSARAVELLLLLPRDRERCFDLSLESADALFRRARRRAGIEDLHFHDARHEALTRLAGKLSVLELARMVGHRDLQSLMIYYNATPDELAAKLG